MMWKSGGLILQALLTVAPPPRVAALLRGGRRCIPSVSTQMMASDGNAENGRVVVLGGGFGGLCTTLRLADLSSSMQNTAVSSITLIDSRERFTFLPLLYELATGEASMEEVSPRFDTLLKDKNIEFKQASINSVNLAGKTVTISPAMSRVDSVGDGDSIVIPFDRLVIAMGCAPAMDVVPGVSEHAVPFYTIDDALRVQREISRLELMDQAAHVVVIGGSYGGVELACSLAQRLSGASITLVERGGDLLPRSPIHNQDQAKAALSNAGVKVRCLTSVLRVETDMVETCAVGKEEEVGMGEQLPADLVLWTAGAKPKSLDGLGDLGSEWMDGTGRLPVDKCLRVNGAEGVFALGDLASVVDEPLPATAQVAFQQSEYAAWNVLASLDTAQAKPLAFRYNDLGEMLSLGADGATVSGGAAFSQVRLSGSVAGIARRLVYAARMPTNEQRLTAATKWAEGSLLRVLVDGLTFPSQTQTGKASK